MTGHIAEETLLGIIRGLYDQFENGTIPNVEISTRTKKNIEIAIMSIMNMYYVSFAG